MVRLEAVLESWKSIRRDTIQAVEDCPAGELDFKPTPDLMSFREIARHILVVGHGLTGLLLEGETIVGGPLAREKMAKFVMLGSDASAQDLVREMRASVDRRTAELVAQPPEFYAGIITRPDGAQATRLEMLQFMKEHELTHRSQLFLYLRLKGIVPCTTRRRLARQAAR